jgi:hypothetical protein
MGTSLVALFILIFIADDGSIFNQALFSALSSMITFEASNFLDVHQPNHSRLYHSSICTKDGMSQFMMIWAV